MTDRIDEKDKQAAKQAIKDHAANTVVDTAKEPLQVVNTTGQILNAPETRMATKLIGGQEAVNNLEKA